MRYFFKILIAPFSILAFVFVVVAPVLTPIALASGDIQIILVGIFTIFIYPLVAALVIGICIEHILVRNYSRSSISDYAEYRMPTSAGMRDFMNAHHYLEYAIRDVGHFLNDKTIARHKRIVKLQRYLVKLTWVGFFLIALLCILFIIFGRN